jgi:glycosyltransferase involved in cell wall biosynthesis
MHDWKGEREVLETLPQPAPAGDTDSANWRSAGRKRKIVFLIDMFIEAGGTERHLLQLAAGLDRQRYDVTICPIHDNNTVMIQRARALGIRVQPFPLKRLYGISVFARTFQFARFLRQEKVDLLQTYHFVSDVWGSFTARLARVPLVISSRRDKGFKETRRHRLIRKITQSCIDATICVSDDLSRQVLQEEKLNAQTVFTAYNGVECVSRLSNDQKQQKRQELGIPQDAIIIGSVMNFRPIKGIDYLVEAAAPICAQYPKVQFVCVGGGANAGSLQYANQLKNRIAELQLADHFVFLGKRRDVRDLLQIFDYFILPSLSEGFSNALIEAMHAGKCIVATQVGGNPEAVVSGEHGILVPPADATAIADAFLQLLANPAETERLGRQAQDRAVTLFTTAHMITRYDQIYSEHLNQTE